jgi:hypothetical protein
MLRKRGIVTFPGFVKKWTPVNVRHGRIAEFCLNRGAK